MTSRSRPSAAIIVSPRVFSTHSQVASFFLKAIFNKNEYDLTASRSTGDEVLPSCLGVLSTG